MLSARQQSPVPPVGGFPTSRATLRAHVSGSRSRPPSRTTSRSRPDSQSLQLPPLHLCLLTGKDSARGLQRTDEGWKCMQTGRERRDGTGGAGRNAARKYARMEGGAVQRMSRTRGTSSSSSVVLASDSIGVFMGLASNFKCIRHFTIIHSFINIGIFQNSPRTLSRT